MMYCWGLGSFYRKPTKGSKCLIGLIANQDAASFLIDCAKFDEAVYYCGNDVELTIKPKGFIVKSQGESLKTVLNEWQTEFGKLCDEINKIVVAIGTGPNVGLITAIKQQVATTLKQRLNKILIA